MKPATPLPWAVRKEPDEPSKDGEYMQCWIEPRIGEIYYTTLRGQQDADYIVHACNAYPKLVEALREHAHRGTQRGDHAIDLLRSLGELE